MKKHKYTIAAILSSFFLIFLIMYSRIEAYCPVYPGIDTYYSKNYAEEKFDKIKVGMSEKNVKDILGEPLWTDGDRNSECWWYSKNGKCKWGKFAWLGRSVQIKDGMVINTDKRICYN